MVKREPLRQKLAAPTGALPLQDLAGQSKPSQPGVSMSSTGTQASRCGVPITCQGDVKFWEKVLSMEATSQNRYNQEREHIMGKQWKQ